MPTFRSIAPQPDPRHHKRLYQWIGLRLLTTTVLLGILVRLSVNDPTHYLSTLPEILTALVMATFGFSILLLLWVPKTRTPSTIAYVQLIYDFCFTTLLAASSGGILSGFTFLYGLNILAAAIILGSRAAYVMASSSVVACLSLLLLQRYAAEHPWLLWLNLRVPATLEEGLFALSLNVTGNVLVGLLAGYLVERLREAGGALAQVRADIAQLSQRQEDIFRSLTSGLITVNTAGRIDAVNPAALHFFALSEQEMLNAPIDAFFPDPDNAPLTATASARLNAQIETVAKRKDGTTFVCGYTSVPLLDAAGKRSGQVLVFRDLSDVIELREQARRAEHFAILGQVAAALAHEIRNPLGSISGAVQLVSESTTISDEDKHLLRIVSTEAERLNVLVTNMLDVARPREVQRTPTSLDALAGEVATIAEQGLYPNKKVDIVWQAPPTPIVAPVDRDQCRQVLWNLLRNAAQVSKGDARIYIRVYHDNTHAVMEVADDGPGIRLDDKASMFDLFVTHRPQGTGIGLALVRQIMIAHGGSIDVDKNEPHGAIFRARFPLTEQPATMH